MIRWMKCLFGTYRGFLLILCFTYLAMVYILLNQIDDNRNPRPHVQKELFLNSKIVLKQNLSSRNLMNTSSFISSGVLKDHHDLVDLPSEDTDLKHCLLSASNHIGSWETLYDNYAYVYSAYLDQRNGKRFVRLMAIVQRTIKKSFLVTCHFANQNSTAVIYEMCENHNKKYGGYILSCPLADNNRACNVTLTMTALLLPPRFQMRPVTLPVISMETSNSLPEFGVCVSPLFGKISIPRFVEFVELTKLLGVQYFIFYDFNVSSEMRKVLNYYDSQNLIKVFSWHLPSVISDKDIWYNGQLIAHNDCVYRGSTMMRRMALNDIDEFIVPQSSMTWKQSFSEFDSGNIAALAFHSVFFNTQNDDIPGLNSMTYTSRTKLFSKIRTKVMIDPQKIFEVGIHHVSKPNKETFHVKVIDSKVAFLYHYRKCINNFGMKCSQVVSDNSMLRYNKTLSSNYRYSMNIIHDILNKSSHEKEH